MLRVVGHHQTSFAVNGNLAAVILRYSDSGGISLVRQFFGVLVSVACDIVLGGLTWTLGGLGSFCL